MTTLAGGILIAVAGPILLKLGFSEVCSNELITLAPALIGGVVAWISGIKNKQFNALGGKV